MELYWSYDETEVSYNTAEKKGLKLNAKDMILSQIISPDISPFIQCFPRVFSRPRDKAKVRIYVLFPRYKKVVTPDLQDTYLQTHTAIGRIKDVVAVFCFC